jgi:hypothetical protein
MPATVRIDNHFLQLFLILFVFSSFTVIIPSDSKASPVTSMGEVSESMVRTIAGNKATVVPTALGRHGLDFVYFDQVAGKNQLFVSEIKSGRAVQRQNLNLTTHEIKLLEQSGIVPQKLSNGQYQIQQGSHAYNLVQFDRLKQRNLNSSKYLEMLDNNDIVSKKQTRTFARHVENLDLPLSPAEKRQMKIIAKTGNIQSMKSFMQRHGDAVRHSHKNHMQLLNKAGLHINKKQYMNQLIRLETQNGRYILRSTSLDTKGNPLLTVSKQPVTREITNVNWKNYRESGPMRALIKGHAATLCGGGKPSSQCAQSVYRSGIRELESGKGLHTAMKQMDSASKTVGMGAASASGKAAASKLTVARPSAAPLRKIPLLNRVGKLLGAGTMTTAAGKAAVVGKGILGSKIVTIGLPIAAAIGGAIMFDMYLDDKIQSHTDGLKQYMGEEFTALHSGMENLGDQISQDLGVMQQNIQDEIHILGADINYGFALTMEALERNAQGMVSLAEMMGDFETRMDYVFSDMNALMIDIATRMDYSIALTEALFNDEFQAGLKFYETYLQTNDTVQLNSAEQAFTRAQARYEDLLQRQIPDETQTHNFQMMHALASYYRSITYAEYAQVQPVYAETAVGVFIDLVEFVRQSGDQDYLERVLPVINYTFASIADVDSNGFTVDLLFTTYKDMIDHALSQERHITARGYANMLMAALPDYDRAQTISQLVSYIIADTEWPNEDIWQQEIEGALQEYAYYRENPPPGSIFALLACAEDLEQGFGLSENCQLSTAQLVQTAVEYQNETIWKFVVWSLIKQNSLKEAQDILNNYYIRDENFRYRSMLITDFFLNPDGFCEKANFIVTNPTFTEELKNFSRDKIQLMGTRCASQSLEVHSAQHSKVASYNLLSGILSESRQAVADLEGQTKTQNFENFHAMR